MIVSVKKSSNYGDLETQLHKHINIHASSTYTKHFWHLPLYINISVKTIALQLSFIVTSDIFPKLHLEHLWVIFFSSTKYIAKWLHAIM